MIIAIYFAHHLVSCVHVRHISCLVVVYLGIGIGTRKKAKEEKEPKLKKLLSKKIEGKRSL